MGASVFDRHRWLWPLTLVAWGLFVAWCVSRFPPCVDLPAHGAQIETLANLLRGDPSVRAYYAVHFPLGYGLVLWLALPFAFIWNGAVAARIALWISLFLWPVSIDVLARSFSRSHWAALLSLPIAFHLSYWYGFLPMLFAEPLVFFSLAAAQHLFRSGSPRALVALSLLALATFLSHLVAFQVLVVLVAALALCTRPRMQSIRRAFWGLLPPLLLSLPKVWSMTLHAVHRGPWAANTWDLPSHFNWFFKTYRPEGSLAAAGALVTTLVLVGLALWREPRDWKPLGLVAAMAAFYLVTPKAVSGMFNISVRLAVFVAVLALLVVEISSLHVVVRSLLLVLAIWSLGETALFHQRFSRAVDGLGEAIAAMPPGMHGYFASEGNKILGSRHIYLEHLGQWVTATRGGVGHHFFADAEHQPVQFRKDPVPASFEVATQEQALPFQHVLVFGDGALPASLADFHLGWRNERYRRLDRSQP
jgi:hypothetical protein